MTSSSIADPREADVRAAGESAPTLDEIRKWPATVSVPRACKVLNISRSHGYELVKADEFPFRVLTLRGRIVVVTSDILHVLGGAGAEVA